MLPKFLFEAEFRNITNDARVLYALLYDRLVISIENQYYDSNSDIYIFFKREDMQQLLGLSDKTVRKVINELKEYLLVEEIKQGLTKENKIFLLYTNTPSGNVSDSRTGDFPIQDRKDLPAKSGNNYDSRSEDFTIQEQENLHDNENIFKKSTNKKNASSIHVILKDGSEILINKSEIIAAHIWEDGNGKSGTTLFTVNMKYELKTLTHFECIELFGNKDFFICNREYVINRAFIDTVDYQGNMLRLKNGLFMELNKNKALMIRRYLNRCKQE